MERFFDSVFNRTTSEIPIHNTPVKTSMEQIVLELFGNPEKTVMAIADKITTTIAIQIEIESFLFWFALILSVHK